MVEKAVRKFLEGNEVRGRVLVSVSGGVDSVVLLEVLRRVGGLGLVVCHLDHGCAGRRRAGMRQL
jgi:tRNA(Ile)-lysidine synthase TilS/MesJ